MESNETRVTNPETGGQKGSKPQRFSLLPWDVLGKLAEHYGKGSRKYSSHNWRRGYEWSLSIDALGRHLAAFIEGETYDPETGSHHMLAVMFHAAALVYFTEAFPNLDDRRKTEKEDPRLTALKDLAKRNAATSCLVQPSFNFGPLINTNGQANDADR